MAHENKTPSETCANSPAGGRDCRQSMSPLPGQSVSAVPAPQQPNVPSVLTPQLWFSLIAID